MRIQENKKKCVGIVDTFYFFIKPLTVNVFTFIMKKIFIFFLKNVQYEENIAEVALTKLEFRREMSHLFAGTIEAIEVDGKSQTSQNKERDQKKKPWGTPTFKGWKRERA